MHMRVINEDYEEQVRSQSVATSENTAARHPLPERHQDLGSVSTVIVPDGAVRNLVRVESKSLSPCTAADVIQVKIQLF